MHEHKDCEHELKYCKICDIVYCEKCGKEWKYYNRTQWITYTYGDNDFFPESNVSVSHNHIEGEK